jgi:hypothetical protein
MIAVFVSTMSLNAKNVKTYSNVERNEMGTKKEYITLDDATSYPLMKEYYHYDANGNILQKTVSAWDSNTGWVARASSLYQYGETGKIVSIVYTKWNNKSESRAGKSDIIIYLYDENNEFLTTKQIRMETGINNDFIAQK